MVDIRKLNSPKETKGKIKGIIFDFDGVLSSFQMRIGWPILNAALMVKPELSRKRIIDTTMVIFDHLTTLEKMPKKTELLKLIFETGKRFGMSNFQALKFIVITSIIYAKNRKRIVPRTGVREVLQELLAQDFIMILLTNSSHGVIKVAKERIPELNRFDLILTRDDLKAIKPSEEGFLKVLELTGLKPEELLSIGDQASDIIASKKVKIRTIATFDEGMEFTKKHLIREKPDFIISDLQEIPELLRFLRDRIIEDIRTTIDLTEKPLQEYLLSDELNVKYTGP